MKAMKYSVLVFFGLLVNFFGFLGIVLTTGSFIFPFVIAAAVGAIHICLRRIATKDTGLSTLWYTLTAQLLPVAGVSVWLIINLVLRHNAPGYDFKGLELWFAEFTLVMLVISTVVSVVFDRITAKKAA
ncbi:MAG: hypothetical protein ACI4WS_07575 [Oscillospiraceae bacterium]